MSNINQNYTVMEIQQKYKAVTLVFSGNKSKFIVIKISTAVIINHKKSYFSFIVIITRPIFLLEFVSQTVIH